MNCRRFFGFRPFWKDRAQDAKKVNKMHPKARQVRSKFAFLGTSWRQVGQHGAILAPTWPILAPRCAPTGIQMEPQMRPKSHLGPSWRQEGRPWAQKCPWSLNFHRFSSNFGPNSIAFRSNFLQFPAPSSARWRLGARSALDISAGPWPRAWQNLGASRIFLNSSSRHPRRAPGR